MYGYDDDAKKTVVEVTPTFGTVAAFETPSTVVTIFPVIMSTSTDPAGEAKMSTLPGTSVTSVALKPTCSDEFHN